MLNKAKRFIEDHMTWERLGLWLGYITRMVILIALFVLIMRYKFGAGSHWPFVYFCSIFICYIHLLPVLRKNTKIAERGDSLYRNLEVVHDIWAHEGETRANIWTYFIKVNNVAGITYERMREEFSKESRKEADRFGVARATFVVAETIKKLSEIVDKDANDGAVFAFEESPRVYDVEADDASLELYPKLIGYRDMPVTGKIAEEFDKCLSFAVELDRLHKAQEVISKRYFDSARNTVPQYINLLDQYGSILSRGIIPAAVTSESSLLEATTVLAATLEGIVLDSYAEMDSAFETQLIVVKAACAGK